MTETSDKGESNFQTSVTEVLSTECNVTIILQIHLILLCVYFAYSRAATALTQSASYLPITWCRSARKFQYVVINVIYYAQITLRQLVEMI